jgi:hypothetical protein
LSAVRPTLGQVFERLGEIQAELAGLAERVGQETQDGAGGTGLTGRIIRTEAKVSTYADAFDAVKHKALGAVAALTLVSALLLAGLKAWLQGLAGEGS